MKPKRTHEGAAVPYQCSLWSGAQLHQLQAEQTAALATQQYLAKEHEYHSALAAQDAQLIAARAKAKQGEFAVRTGIINTPDPGKVRILVGNLQTLQPAMCQDYTMCT